MTSNIVKILGAIAALATAITGTVVAFTGGCDNSPQPVTTIIIQQPGDYQNFLDTTDLSQYQDLKQ